MNIYDIDGMGKYDVDGTNVKTFYKVFHRDDIRRIEVGCDAPADSGSEHVYLAFEFGNNAKVCQHLIFSSIDCETEHEPLKVSFSCTGEHEIDAFIQALEFAVGVLKESRWRDRVF